MVRVLLVDDEPEIRLVVRTALRLRHDIEIVGEATTTFSAAQLATEQDPDLVVLDLGLPDTFGEQTYEQVQNSAGLLIEFDRLKETAQDLHRQLQLARETAFSGPPAQASGIDPSEPITELRGVRPAHEAAEPPIEPRNA